MATSTASPSHTNTKSPTIRRILREAAELSNTPSPDYTAEPLESDLFEWHFTLRGPPNSPYSQGIYHGRIILPPAYPLRPPSFRFSTPNGRFEANREICLSISGHHEETWQPAWGIRTALVALRSFMETDVLGQLGGLETTEAVRRRLAQESTSFKCAVCARTNADIIAECEDRCKQAASSSSDISVPAELNMAWRDELETTRDQASSPGSNRIPPRPSSGEGTSDAAELAEGFVQTTPSRPNDVIAQPALPMQAPGTRRSSSTTHQVRTGSDEVPLWIDRVIVALVILLAALVLKVLLGR
ncbi:UBC-like protein [Trichoderma citrinoviride]|uniref:UBC-like protein n=1 Tax=Trichoderma citrinoviride TaxID=58853 RepID=A0A2T4B0A0_9HYPO|nr:UBC-like protein [Trichoderma citrinoviride]PTB62749.1 UBC-like protein [Trichoderma citrinoviride]